MDTSFDVIVAGGGAAGVRAAIAAADAGASVALIAGDEFCASGSTYYPLSPAWGIMYADSDKELFYQEIMGSCMGCVKPELVRRLVEDSSEVYGEMREWGLNFISLEDLRLKTCFGGVLRGAVLDDVASLKASFQRELLRRRITVIARLAVVDLLVDDEGCCGVLCSDQKGELSPLFSGAVVLAMGGGESLWQYRCAGNRLLGGAYAIAARHGAKLVNLEFIQFLLGTISPLPHTLFYHFTMKTMPQLLNEDGEPLPLEVSAEECLLAHAGHGPFTTIDRSMYIERAILRESERRGRPSCAQLIYTRDIRQMPEFSHWTRYLTRMRVDPMAQPFLLFPHCQGFNGGIEIDGEARTGIPGVYACGESAGGIHGANRMGGNSILATQVFGRIAGKNAAKFARKGAGRGKKTVNPFAGREDRLSAEEALERLREIMQTRGFIERNESELTEGLQMLKELEDGFSPAVQARKTLSDFPYRVGNALTAAMLILYSMKNRTETRGGHLRTDAPGTDEKGALRPIVLSDVWADLAKREDVKEDMR